MRKNYEPQRPLSPQISKHHKARQYEEISNLLDTNSTIYDLVAKDLGTGVSIDTGRKGMTAEQVMRCAMLRAAENCDYRELAFRLEDSAIAQWFSRLPMGKAVSFQTLQQNIKQIKEDTWVEINGVLVRYAQTKGIEDGKKARTDCTVVKGNIHHPTDNSLLLDCVRKLTALMEEAREDYAGCSFPLRDHRRAAKRRCLEVMNAKNDGAR